MRERRAFALEAVLEHRKRVEEQRQQAVSIWHRAHADARRGLGLLERELCRRSRVMPARDLQLLERAIETQAAMVAERSLAFENARQASIVASQERAVIDELKNRQEKELRSKRALLEQLELDEINARNGERRARVSP
jgi:flagellar biosynthesis chaperone FliJ